MLNERWRTIWQILSLITLGDCSLGRPMKRKQVSDAYVETMARSTREQAKNAATIFGRDYYSFAFWKEKESR